jgi:putative component of membrane protein insertase Oxa1/YidC/SpoIIIJ protein YidD
MHMLHNTGCLVCRGIGVAVLLLFLAIPRLAMAEQPESHSNAHSSAWTSPIRFFQKYISKADGDRCPMYPSCSHYASKAIQRHGAVKGWIIACDRLLRCGHDEVRLAPKVSVKGKVRSYDPLEANTRWWSKP